MQEQKILGHCIGNLFNQVCRRLAGNGLRQNVLFSGTLWENLLQGTNIASSAGMAGDSF